MSADIRIHRDQRGERRPAIVRGNVVIAGVATMVFLVVANLVIRFIGMNIADISEGFTPLSSAFPTVLVSFIYAFGAITVFALLLHFSATPVRHFLIIAAIAFVLSFVPLLLLRSSEDSTTGALAILGVMHVVSALITIPLIIRLGR